MTRKRSPLPAGFGKHGDDPSVIMTAAVQGVSRDPRLSAERAYLAIHTALENMAGDTFRTDSAQRAAVGRLAKHSKKLARTFNTLKRSLHGECFYQGACDAGSAGVAIGKAAEWLTQLPKRLPAK